MRSATAVLIMALAAGDVAAQIYRWTDEQGHVHYGESLPPGQKADSVTHTGSGNSAATAVPGGPKATVPLPPPSARDLEIQRRQQEYADRADREQEEKERAAMRNSAAGIYYCQQLEQAIQRAQQPSVTEEQRVAALKELGALREKNCR
jgi:environmental stress-induced protein Ves